MSPQKAGEQAVEERLEQIEGANRRLQQWIGDVERQNVQFKRIAVAAVAVAALAAVACVILLLSRVLSPGVLPADESAGSPVGAAEGLTARVKTCERELGRVRVLSAKLDELERASERQRPRPDEPDISRCETLVTRKILLRDAAGASRAALMVEKGETVLRLADAKGATRLMISVRADGAGILLVDGRNKPKFVLTDSPKGIVLALTGGSGKNSVMVGAMANGEAGITLRDRKGKTRMDLDVGKNAFSRLAVRGPRKGDGIVLEAGPRSATMVVYDDGVKQRLSLGTERGGPSITISDREGTGRAVLGCSSLVTVEGPKKGTKSQTPESSIHLFGEDGKVLWAAP